jgi:pimeloyl-ACP methyl ester carboxylesterase
MKLCLHALMSSSYWDLSFNNYNYSYINTATENGYCTLSFDRLRIANSSHGEPLNEIQAYLEVEATAALTRMLRNGTFPNVNHTFTKVVHVGHSFGSAQTYSLANLYPNIIDGIVLTGFSMNASFMGLFTAGGNFQQANQNAPLRFSNVTGTQVSNLLSMYAENLVDFLSPIDLITLPTPQNLPNGYIISSNVKANKYLFFKSHYYDPAILTLAEKTKQPITEGELLTLGALVPMNNYAGPSCHCRRFVFPYLHHQTCH